MKYTKETHDLLLLRFGRKLREVRLQKKLSYKALSQRCDMEVEDLQRIEEGKRNFNLSTAIELAMGLRVHPKELFDFDMSPALVKGNKEKKDSESI